MVEHKCDCGGEKALEGEVSPFCQPLQRYRLKEHPSCVGCPLAHGVLEEGIHILARSSPTDIGKDIVNEFNRVKTYLEGRCQCYARKYFKKRTGLFKMGGRYIHRSWRALCYWEMLYGYTEYKGLENMKEEIEEWLVKPRVLGGPLQEADYLEMLAEEFASNLEREWRLPDNIPSLDTWIKTGKWMRGKSGTGITTTVLIDGKNVRTRRIKGIEATVKTDVEMIKNMLYSSRESFHVLEKSEGAKSRPVVKTGNDLFRKMDFLSEWVEKGVYNSKTSTLYADARTIQEIDEEIMQAVENTRLYKVPMDQSNFDWHQNRASIITIMLIQGIHMFEKGAPEEYIAVWGAMWDSLFSQKVNVVLGEQIMEWLNGLPSGLRWTAYLDTELNKSSFAVTKKLAERTIKTGIPIFSHVSQGDDINYATTRLEYVQWILHIYNSIGYEAHPAKTFISKERTEFLRKSYEKGFGVTGYNVRTMLSIRFRNPIRALPVVKAMRLYSRVTIWHLLLLRGGDGERIAQMALEDAEQLGVRKHHAAGFILCPAAFGGAGLDWGSSMARHIRRYYQGPFVPDVIQERRRILPNLGRWKERINQWATHLERDQTNKFYDILAKSWGIPEKDIYGDVKVNWEPVGCKIIPPPPVATPMPEPDAMWNVENIPVILRPHVKEGAIRKGTYKLLIKPEMLETVERFKKRVSKRVFEAYMLGYLTISWPIIDNISMSYGDQIKKKYQHRISQFINQKDISMAQVKAYMAYYEILIAQELKCYRRGRLLAV
ncbi:hypothetical protein 2 [Hubei toti-like virus 19]|uniref:RNA-directed RNA polymerase n=1 Tax=Hubei toti-like virus 19 TaxID=1923307 RepID=A0A1L3KF20_9VIRU|nr:hypothetical protein 2 [Hubei toti-like virus 19]APG76006.1 hypothetical protein 2 [Hubei toti-like virus 19]